MQNKKVLFSPVGAGTITGITQAGFPQVNHVAVCWLVFEDLELLDRIAYFQSNKWKLLIDSSQEPVKPFWLTARSVEEAIRILEKIRPLPGEITFGSLPGGVKDTEKILVAIQAKMDKTNRPLPKGFTYNFVNHSTNQEKVVETMMQQMLLQKVLI